MQAMSVFASICLCCFLISKVSNWLLNSSLDFMLLQVCPQPVVPFSSCGCLEESDTFSLTDTREVSLSASQCYGVCAQQGAEMFTFDNQEGKNNL